MAVPTEGGIDLLDRHAARLRRRNEQLAQELHRSKAALEAATRETPGWRLKVAHALNRVSAVLAGVDPEHESIEQRHRVTRALTRVQKIGANR